MTSSLGRGGVLVAALVLASATACSSDDDTKTDTSPTSKSSATLSATKATASPSKTPAPLDPELTAQDAGIPDGQARYGVTSGQLNSKAPTGSQSETVKAGIYAVQYSCVGDPFEIIVNDSKGQIFHETEGCASRGFGRVGLATPAFRARGGELQLQVKSSGTTDFVVTPIAATEKDLANKVSGPFDAPFQLDGYGMTWSMYLPKGKYSLVGTCTGAKSVALSVSGPVADAPLKPFTCTGKSQTLAGYTTSGGHVVARLGEATKVKGTLEFKPAR